MTLHEDEQIRQARTVILPGGVTLTSEERTFRSTHDLPKGTEKRALIVARSILTKVRNACAGSDAG